MNREWSEQNKNVQLMLKKRETYSYGISELIDLRDKLMQTVSSFGDELSADDFSAMPFPNAEGYHSKTVAYSLWHIFRIEDIVAHTLINDDEQVFFTENYSKRIGSPIITTGNELAGEKIAEFSRCLDIGQLYSYISDVKKATEEILRGIGFEMLKKKIPPERKEKLCRLDVVSSDDNAVWLIDYWCGKDIRGLIQMPFSRHWIMHIEACLRIRDKLIK